MAQTSFSLDIGEHFLKIADVERKADKLNALSIAYDISPVNVYVSDGVKDKEQVSTLMDKLIRDAGIKKKNVNIIIPDSHTYSQILEMPSVTEKELLSAIKYQADQFIPIPIDKVNLDIEIVAEDKQNKKLLILLVAAPLTLLEKVNEIVEGNGLVVDMIINEAAANMNMIPLLNGKSVGYRLLINFGYSATTLYLIGPSPYGDKKEIIPLQIRNFNIGYDIFLKDMKANFTLSDKEIDSLLETSGFVGQEHTDVIKIISSPYNEFVAQVQKLLQSLKAQSNIAIEKIELCGEGYKLKGFDAKLTQSLAVPTTLIDIYPIFQKNNVSDFFQKDLPLLLPSIGATIL